ncbi:MAG: gamma-glutamylcyclotransferase [Leptospiraceae bacterium]|nr:gamma-glutamylcyclotransferase [Leptospiraceae bacterium]MDW7977082.1 gamma-glutamylcyclotransferase family protein [Leptospiraceae bacterium]
MEFLFVYGTLLSKFHHPLSIKLKKEGIYLGKGFVFGKLYDLGEYPAAKPAKDSIVIGEIYRVPAILFFDLDFYEDYNQYNLKKSLFVRKRTKSFLIPEDHHYANSQELIQKLHEFQKIFSFIYWYNQPLNLAVWIESGDYLKYLEEKKQFSF